MSWSGIPVFLRHADETTGRQIGTCEAGDLDDVVEKVRAWGYPDEADDPCGQFFEHGFEVIVGGVE